MPSKRPYPSAFWKPVRALTAHSAANFHVAPDGQATSWISTARGAEIILNARFTGSGTGVYRACRRGSELTSPSARRPPGIASEPSLLHDAFAQRQSADYGFEFAMTPSAVEELVANASALLEGVTAHLRSAGFLPPNRSPS